MAVYEFATRVGYDDIGKDMILTLRGAMGMMQEAAIIHSDLTGYSINNSETTHVVWMLVQWRVRLVEAVSWNEDLIVRTWPRTMERATSERDFEIVDMQGRIAAIGESVWVLVSTDTGRILRIPPDIASAYDLTDRAAFTDQFTEPDKSAGEEAFWGRVLRRDIDTNEHVNNRVYLDYAMEALPGHICPEKFSEAYIKYRRQMLLGQSFRCMYHECASAHTVDICDESGAVHATVVFR